MGKSQRRIEKIKRLIMKKTYLTDSDVQRHVQNIIRQVVLDNFQPDYVVGITRGGLVPALMISHYFNIPCETLKVSLRDGNQCVSDTGMSEDAFGYVGTEEQKLLKCRWDINKRKNILVVDDINDSGATIQWIKNDWQNSCLPSEVQAWESVWNHTVKFATIYDNESSDFNDVAYSAVTINKLENPEWIVFPWEEWWK